MTAGDGVTVKVGIKYEASSPRRISLKFQEAGFSDVRITPLTEALIAPAILPRGWLQQQALLAIKEARPPGTATLLSLSQPAGHAASCCQHCANHLLLHEQCLA